MKAPKTPKGGKTFESKPPFSLEAFNENNKTAKTDFADRVKKGESCYTGEIPEDYLDSIV